MITVILTMKQKDKKKQKTNLIVNLLELILMDKILVYVEIGKIFNHIKKSNEKLTKKSLIDKISKRLSELKFKSSHSTL